MRGGGSGAFLHHGSMPQQAILDQLSGAAAMTPNNAISTAGGLKSSQSRQNLPSAPELDYDPFYANQ